MSNTRDKWALTFPWKTVTRQWLHKACVLHRLIEELQRAQVVRIKIEAVSLDSTSIKFHPDGTGA